jgi:hypothetical protein
MSSKQATKQLVSHAPQGGRQTRGLISTSFGIDDYEAHRILREFFEHSHI